MIGGGSFNGGRYLCSRFPRANDVFLANEMGFYTLGRRCVPCCRRRARFYNLSYLHPLSFSSRDVWFIGSIAFWLLSSLRYPVGVGWSTQLLNFPWRVHLCCSKRFSGYRPHLHLRFGFSRWPQSTFKIYLVIFKYCLGYLGTSW